MTTQREIQILENVIGQFWKLNKETLEFIEETDPNNEVSIERLRDIIGAIYNRNTSMEFNAVQTLSDKS